jgi:hypothetical protein
MALTVTGFVCFALGFGTGWVSCTALIGRLCTVLDEAIRNHKSYMERATSNTKREPEILKSLTKVVN